MRGVIRLAFIAVSLTATTASLAGDLTQAPPPFEFREQTVVPIDIKSVHVDYTFDAAAQTAVAHARMVFRPSQTGLPMFDLVPDATSLTLDGEAMDPADLLCINDPDTVTRLRVLLANVDADGDHQLEMDYPITDAVTFDAGKVRVGFFMWDLTTGGREFMEQYAPANFEFDNTDFSFGVRVVGTDVEHEVFANGAVVSEGPNAWQVSYPSYFTASSAYFHLADKGHFVTERFDYIGVGATIPVTVYSEDAARVRDAVTKTRATLAELESTYGAFAHQRLIVYVTPSGGGMEYCGATMTSLSALSHELTHSWFARGVMPADGNAGWIDEAVASWRDNGYPRATSAPDRAPVNLGGFSPYRRHTTYEAYGLGAKLMSEFDYLFRDDGGLKPVLKQLFAARQRSTITVPMLQGFLETDSGLGLGPIFDRYVYGKTVDGDGVGGVQPESLVQGLPVTHPRPYTKAEAVAFR